MKTLLRLSLLLSTGDSSIPLSLTATGSSASFLPTVSDSYLQHMEEAEIVLLLFAPPLRGTLYSHQVGRIGVSEMVNRLKHPFIACIS